MAIPGPEESHPEFIPHLDRLRAELGELRRELAEELCRAEEDAPTDEESYKIATQIDFLVTKFLRLFGRGN